MRDEADTPTPKQAHPSVRRAGWIARILDQLYVDPLLGIVAPGAGDLVASAFGLYLVVLAVRRRLPGVVIVRMLINLGLDTAIGAIPVAGDVFDFFFKANQRNLRILEARERKHRASAYDWVFVTGAALAVLAALAIPVAVVMWLVTWIV